MAKIIFTCGAKKVAKLIFAPNLDPDYKSREKLKASPMLKLYYGGS